MQTIICKDNSTIERLRDIEENSAEFSFWREISDTPISELKNLGQILTIPNYRRDELTLDTPICMIDRELKIHTGNIVGFIGNKDVSLSIHSRFADNGKSDFFIHYMLFKVLGFSITQSANSFTSLGWLDLLPFLFPEYLRKALSKGIYRPYVHISHNNSKFRGKIDLSRHLRLNMPFSGSVAYNTREKAEDNSITQLIRHTIEILSRDKLYSSILSSDNEVRNYVCVIKDITPSFDSRNLKKILTQNSQPFVHPFFTEYSPLIKLCKLIINHKKGAYSDSKNRLNGLLIDISWLWEEYLAKIMKPLAIIHPNNRIRKDAIYIFNGKKSNGRGTYAETESGERYPDFYNDLTVFDAKYKFLEENVQREDIHQLITYMYVLNKKYGMLISPALRQGNAYDTFRLNGVGGELTIAKMSIPQNCHNISDFCDQIINSENNLIEFISKQH